MNLKGFSSDESALHMIIENLGAIDYRKALALQELTVAEICSGAREKIFICHHPPIVTLGKKSLKTDLCGWPGEVAKVGRGGRATYHGPGQIVIYPIINLKNRNSDIFLYLRDLERVVIETLKNLGISARGDSAATGVWVEERKIASIGIAIRRWVTYHGLALNLFYDPEAFVGIHPCGFTSNTMVHINELLPERVERPQVESLLTENLLKIF